MYGAGDTDSGFLEVDGVQIWTRGRAGRFNCRPGFVDDSSSINGTSSLESKCYRDIDLNVPHSSLSLTLAIGATLSSCATSQAVWGFSNVQVPPNKS
jgi:hypothetical protein